MTCPLFSLYFLRQRKHHQRLFPRGLRIVKRAGAAGNDGEVLFSIFALIRHRDGVRAHIEPGGPQFFTGFGIEGAEAFVIGCGNKDETACCRDRPAMPRN